MPKNNKANRNFFFLLLAAVAVVTLTVLMFLTYSSVQASGPSIFAAKGGGGGGGSGGHGGGKGGTAACNTGTSKVALVSANPVPVGTAPTFRASGFPPGGIIFMSMSGYIKGDYGYADSTGSITYTFYTPMYYAGSWTFTISQDNGVNCANVSFKVQ